MECRQEGLVGCQTTEQTSIETIDGLAEETEQEAPSQGDCLEMKFGEGFEGVCLVKGFAALERLDLDDSSL